MFILVAFARHCETHTATKSANSFIPLFVLFTRKNFYKSINHKTTTPMIPRCFATSSNCSSSVIVLIERPLVAAGRYFKFNIKPEVI